jgi:uncharacterized radical SAM superfamily protein
MRTAHHPATIRFDRPARTLPVSLTGIHCALDCAHCGGHYLKHMRPIWKVDGDTDDHTSYLISGGCDPAGRVPIGQRLEQVAALKPGRRLNWHVGLIEEKELLRIAPYVDVVSFDMVGDCETAREVYGLDASPDDYLRTLEMLRRHVPVVPHLTLGLRGGRISGERAALRAMSELGLNVLTLILFIPTEGTAYADRPPLPLPDVADLLLEARHLLPETQIYLGCMRPWGTYRQTVDELAVRAGLNAIVNPTRTAEKVAAEMGLEITWGDECCSLSRRPE